MTILQTKDYPYKIYITEYPGTGDKYGKLIVFHDQEGYARYLQNKGFHRWHDFFCPDHLFDNQEEIVKRLRISHPDIEEFPRSHPDRHKLKGVW